MQFMRASQGWNKRDWCHFPNIMIPWTMLEPHNEQAKKNHAGQSLEVLYRRGGLSCCEAMAILEDRKWERMDANEAHDKLTQLVADWNATNLTP